MVLTLTSCLDQELPTGYASGEQLEKSSDALDKLLNGLCVQLVEYDSYGSNSGSSNDWGFPCQMVIRDCMCEDFLTTGSYDYFSYISDGTALAYFPIYTYFYYYKLVSSANSLISSAGGVNTTANKSYAGVGLAFRAMCYLDLTRMFEFRETGYTDLDAKATNNKVWGLTVPIVTDSTSLQASRTNARVPYYTMYRFILNDLNAADAMLDGYSRTRADIPDQSVVWGLKARFWLELASRFEKSASDLATQLEHEGDNDGYTALGITTANDCYAKAAEYAKKAMEGHSMMTTEDWYNTKTGFNTAADSWLWAAKQSNKDNINSYYYTWMGTMNSEGDLTLAKYGTYRCIGAQLFSEIADGDWRKKSWINPDDESRTATTGYSATAGAYATVLSSATLTNMDDYANLKFHTGSGNVDDYQVALLCDIPMMRAEEMEYIYIEAIAHTQGVAAAKSELESFTTANRYDNATYTCDATTIEDFTDELIRQKRIELWGEGLVYFDYKRLALPVTRNYEGTNFVSTQRLNSKEGYVAPWMNYYVPEYENAYNPAVVLNPDPSGVVVAE